MVLFRSSAQTNYSKYFIDYTFNISFETLYNGPKKESFFPDKFVFIFFNTMKCFSINHVKNNILKIKMYFRTVYKYRANCHNCINLNDSPRNIALTF